MRSFIIALLCLPYLAIAQDSANVTLVSSIHLPLYVNGVSVQGSFAYVAQGANGLRVIDISNLGAPRLRGLYNTPASANTIRVRDNFAFLGDGTTLRVYDITDPEHVLEVASLATDHPFGNMTLVGDYLYAALYTDGIAIFDISDPLAPTEIGFSSSGYEWEYALDVAVAGNYAYVADWEGGILRIVDVSDPTTPVTVDTMRFVGSTTGVAVAGDYAYVETWLDGLHVLDISDPTNAVEVASLEWLIEEGVVFRGIELFGDHAVVDVGTTLQVLNISDPLQPTEVGYYRCEGGISDVSIRDGLVYCAASPYFIIFDVTTALPVHDIDPSFISAFALHPIYPNPFNNTANISFDLPREITGRLVVYDVTGRAVRELYQGRLAAGAHQMPFMGNGLASGTYLVRLETPTHSATQKALLLK